MFYRVQIHKIVKFLPCKHLAIDISAEFTIFEVQKSSIMKKLFFTLLFAFGFMLIGFANQNQQEQLAQQKDIKTNNEQLKKYDFSLFKFVTPYKEKQDTVKVRQEKLRIDKSKDETTYNFHKPHLIPRFS